MIRIRYLCFTFFSIFPGVFLKIRFEFFPFFLSYFFFVFSAFNLLLLIGALFLLIQVINLRTFWHAHLLRTLAFDLLFFILIYAVDFVVGAIVSVEKLWRKATDSINADQKLCSCVRDAGGAVVDVASMAAILMIGKGYKKFVFKWN